MAVATEGIDDHQMQCRTLVGLLCFEGHIHWQRLARSDCYKYLTAMSSVVGVDTPTPLREAAVGSTGLLAESLGLQRRPCNQTDEVLDW